MAGSKIHGVALDSSGNIYFEGIDNLVTKDGVFQQIEIGKLSSGPGHFPSTSITSGLNDPYGIAFDSEGNLYVLNKGNNTIEKYSASGTDLGAFVSGGLLASPTYIAVTSDAGQSLLQPTGVPEPSTWALLFLSSMMLCLRQCPFRKRVS